MISFANAQQRAYQALQECGYSRFFLRIADQVDALWVSDLPRHAGDLRAAEQALTRMGIVWKVEAHTRLLSLDWTVESYANMLSELPTDIPSLPVRDALQPAYALCRLLLLHPGLSFAEQTLAFLRVILKLCQAPQTKLLQSIPTLHAECAERLRKHQPLPCAAGQVLAQWLVDQEEEEAQ